MAIDWDKPVSGEATAVLARIILGDSSGIEVESSAPLDATERIERLSAALGERAAVGGSFGMRADDSDEQIIQGARSGLAKIEADGPAACITVLEAAGLNAVFVTDGTRPVLTVKNDLVDTSQGEVGSWKGLLEGLAGPLREVIRAVGGIRVPNRKDPVGTAFVLAPGLVVTARHVLEAIASRLDEKEWVFNWKGKTTIDFVGEGNAAHKTAFQITKVEFAGPNPIDGTCNFANLDMAILRVDQGSDQGFPPPARFATDQGALGRGQKLCVIGFPASVLIEAAKAEDPKAKPKARHEFAWVTKRLFHDTFGIKRLAPGEVAAIPAAFKDKKVGKVPWVFAHDCSTLGGNSGSAVVDLASKQARVIGLHFYGVSREQNYAHTLSVLQERIAADGTFK